MGRMSVCSTGPVIAVDVPKNVRIKRLVKEYGDVDRDGFAEALKGITKKLGGQHFKAASEKLQRNEMADAIDIILTYYDKAYTNGLSRKRDRIKRTLQWDGCEIESIRQELISSAQENEFEPVGR